MEDVDTTDKLRVLVVEDVDDDLQLCLREMRRNGFTPEYECVDNAKAFLGALSKGKWDVILCDFSMPAFSGSEALSLSRSQSPDVPFIFVSGTIGEENAVAALQEGAQDYVLKQDLRRLTPAIRRALRFAEERRARLKVEQQLRQSQKMEIVGQLTGGIAHDFNNMLTIVLGNLELLELECRLSPEQQQLVQQAMEAGQRGTNLVKSLSAFARRQVLQPQQYDLNAGVSGALPLLERAIGAHIEIQLRQSRDLWTCVLDPTQFISAVTNLAINARDAMPGGGVLEIVSSNVRITPQESLNAKGISPGEYVCLSVTDSGTGMTALTKEQAIEPFFTTKRVGQGTGLGLSMVYGFVSQSGGDIEIESEVGQGTTVNLYFPRNVIGTTASNPEDRETPAQTSRRLRVLVVEDEPMVLSLAERALQALQHEVITAEDGPQALQQLQADNKIDLLFTDLVMPNGMLGVELARLALELQPELKVLFTSGNPAMLPSDLREEMSRMGPILHKPWTRADLKKALIAALPG